MSPEDRKCKLIDRNLACHACRPGQKMFLLWEFMLAAATATYSLSAASVMLLALPCMVDEDLLREVAVYGLSFVASAGCCM